LSNVLVAQSGHVTGEQRKDVQPSTERRDEVPRFLFLLKRRAQVGEKV